MTTVSPDEAPPKGFEKRPLAISEIAKGSIWRRLYLNRYPNPLGYGFGPSRFSDPETRPCAPRALRSRLFWKQRESLFSGSDPSGSRRRPDQMRSRSSGRSSKIGPARNCASTRLCASSICAAIGLVRMGVPTDVARARSQELGRLWSRALWSHDTTPDGIVYDSRLNSETNIALYDRALAKLSVIATPKLVECRSELARIIVDFDLAIV